MSNIPLLKKLSETAGVSGAEGKIREIIRTEISSLADEITVDPLGNIIVHIKGSKKSPRLLIDAHMDEVGFMVSRIEAGGFIRVVPIGGIDPRVFYAQRVVVWGKEPVVGIVGAVPPHLTRNDVSERDKSIPIEECFVDTGLGEKRVQEIVHIGDTVTFDSHFVENDGAIIGKAFDDRAGVYAMIEAVKAAEKIACDLYLVGAVQEEIGLRGATAAVGAIKPDIFIAAEGTFATDFPNVPSTKRYAVLGKGPEFRLSDGRMLADSALVNFIVALGDKHNVPYQIMVKKAGATDAAVAQLIPGGTHAAAMALPTRYIHSPYGVALRSDLDAMVRLLTLTIEHADEFPL